MCEGTPPDRLHFVFTILELESLSTRLENRKESAGLLAVSTLCRTWDLTFDVRLDHTVSSEDRGGEPNSETDSWYVRRAKSTEPTAQSACSRSLCMGLPTPLCRAAFYGFSLVRLFRVGK